MCDLCYGCYDDDEVVDLIKNNDVDDDILICQEGWAEISRVWGRYGWGKKLITTSEWKAVCRARGEVQFGN